MSPEILISAAYVAISAAHARTAIEPNQILVALMYLLIATIYLVAPYVPKGRRILTLPRVRAGDHRADPDLDDDQVEGSDD